MYSLDQGRFEFDPDLLDDLDAGADADGALESGSQTQFTQDDAKASVGALVASAGHTKVRRTSET